ncbi:cytochrome d ubiquinol oxidase subunit II, partial [Bacillus licheniformis]|nr:cytochrome d ubiquinol oxidase subunit II [Bacillus licheniformis]
MDVTVIWAAIIALGLFMYVVLDGFDLGIGIVFPFFPDEKERDLMMNTVAPVWDGNETWLVLGGAGLFAVFPVVYSTVLSALYLPLIFMLVCLIFRGVSFEIRAKARRTKQLWDLAFIGGSAGATLFQGIALGAFLQGIDVKDGVYAGGAFDCLTPFSLLTGLGLIVTYALLGCCWLVAKTEG